MSSLALTRLNQVPKSATVYVSGVYKTLAKPVPMHVEDDHHVHIAIPSAKVPLTNNGMQKSLINGNMKAKLGLSSNFKFFNF